MSKSKNKRVIYKNKSKRNKTKKNNTKKNKNKIQNGGNDFDVVHTVDITEYEGEVVTYGLVSCTSIFWHWKDKKKNYLVHTHSLQEGDATNAYNQALYKMRLLNVKDITIYVYYGTYKLNEKLFSSYCESNNITIKYNHYSGLRLYFIGLTKEGILISSPISNSSMKKYVLREIEQTDYYKNIYKYILEKNIDIQPYEIIENAINSEELVLDILISNNKYNPLYEQFLHKIIEFDTKKYVVYNIYKNDGSLNCYLYNKDKDYIIDGKFTISIKPDIKDVKISDEQDKYLENKNYLNAIHFLFRTVKLKDPPKLHIKYSLACI